MGSNPSELRLGVLMDARDHIHAKHEAKLAELDGKDASHDDKELLRGYREQLEDHDKEIAELSESVERNNAAMEQSRKIRRALAGTAGVDEDGDGIVYRTMAEYARDVVITGNGREAVEDQRHPRRQAGARTGRVAARAAEEDTGEHAVGERRRA